MTEGDLAVLSDPILRGQEAERILSSPLWIEVWTRMESQVYEAWKSEKSMDLDVLAELKRTHMALTKVKANLESEIANGKIEQANQQRSLRERVSDWFSRDAA